MKLNSMIYLQQNIRFLRKNKGFTQGQLAEKLGIKRSLIGAYEEERAVPKLLIIQQLSQLFGVSIDRLLTIDLSKEKVLPAGDFRVLATVVDSNNEERISIVPVKALAGYLNGLADPDYVAELPHFALPVSELSHGLTYRVFQIKGDSMLPVPPGAYIFCSYLESFSGIKNGKPYIVITANDGIVYKRVYNHVEEDGTLLLKSDNEEYQPYRVTADSVLEIWQALGYLTFELPEPDEMDIHQISSMLYKMQDDIKQLKCKTD
jgi:DNA-binding XRE family transcriptional regulator